LVSAVLLFLAIHPLAASAAEPPPIRDFARHPGFKALKLSPDGTYIAATVPREGETGLAFIRLADMKVTGAIRAGRDTHVYDFWWVGPTRVVVSMAESEGPLDLPALTGELMAANADGSQVNYLYGYRGSNTMAARTRSGTQEFGLGFMLNPLPDDPGHAAISVTRFPNYATMERRTTPHRIDVYTGKLDNSLAPPPMEGSLQYLVDDKAQVRYAVGRQTSSGDFRTFVRDLESGEWKPLGKAAGSPDIIPLRVSADDRHVFLQARLGTDRYCLLRQLIGTEQIEPLACHEQADLDRVMFASDGKTPLMARFQAGKPEMVPVNTEHPDSKVAAALAGSFPGQTVQPVSWTRDGSRLIVLAYSDRNPGDFYLYDRKTNKAAYLLSRAEWIDPERMAETRPISYASRDGKTLFGYLTLPPGKDPRALPLVVNPHGGPFGIRDEWDWEPDAQLLASRGYAVLKINFRGSGGYGEAYQESAKQRWGTMMIDDITDGVRWAIKEGFADPGRVCIYGGSYGGYAALMSAVREPDLYRCVIGYAGVYDLALLRKDSDITEHRGGKHYFVDYIGENPDVLREQSPLTYIDKLKADVFIVHGEADRRTPFSQATALRAALKKKDHPYEWLTKAREGHGFGNEDNRAELYEKMLTFLGRNIGEGAKLTKNAGGN
jgi:dienelactone hydrolase